MASFKSYYNAHVSILTEGFSVKNLDSAVSKVKNVLQRSLGYTLYRHFGVEQFANASGNGIGIKFYIGDTTQAIRFNFVQYGSTNEIDSVDIWDKQYGKSPIARVNLNGYSVVKLIPQLVDVIKSPNSWVGQMINIGGEQFDPPVEEPPYGEAYRIGDQTFDSKSKAAIYLYQQGHSPQEVSAALNMHISQAYTIRKQAAMAPTVVVGEEEQVIDPDVIAGNKLLDQQQYANPEEVFDDLKDLVDLVATGKQASLIVTGMAGIGKTHDVTTHLFDILGPDVDEMEAGEAYTARWVHIKGYSTPAGLYKTFFENRTRLIVFDDCDSILKDANAINILKGALDSYDRRMIQWITNKNYNPEGMTDEEIQARYDDDGALPKKFEFRGQVIFISNLRKHQLENALLSRSMAIDVTLKAEDVFLRIHSILDKLAPGVDDEYKQEAYEHLKGNYGELQKDVNLRTMINAAKIRSGGSPNWKRLIERYS